VRWAGHVTHIAEVKVSVGNPEEDVNLEWKIILKLKSSVF
jgi:hypothetical protein